MSRNSSSLPGLSIPGHYRLEVPEHEELESRIAEHMAVYDGAPPRDVVTCWSGYIAALVEWGMITEESFLTLLTAMPRIDANPALEVLAGSGDSDTPA